MIMSQSEQRIKQKVEALGKPLKEWNITINFGIKTGFNEAFIVDGAKKDALLAEDPKCVEILKPILRGRDIKRCGYDFADLWVIATFPCLHINIDKFPAIKKHLLSFGKHRLEQSGKRGSRKKSNNKWFETQDVIAYWKDFSKPKLVYPDIMGLPRGEDHQDDYPYIHYDTESFYIDATNFLMTGEDIDLIFLFLLSDVGFHTYTQFYAGPLLGATGFRYKKAYLQELFVPRFDEQTTKKLRAAMKELPSSRETIERIIEDFYGFTDEEKETIRTYKKRLLTDAEIALIESSVSPS
jgi:hypothetical protein